MEDVQLTVDDNEDFGYLLVKLDDDLIPFDTPTLPVCEHTSLLGGGQNWKHLAGSSSGRWRKILRSVCLFRRHNVWSVKLLSEATSSKPNAPLQLPVPAVALHDTSAGILDLQIP
jgi:hypothetical protein